MSDLDPPPIVAVVSETLADDFGIAVPERPRRADVFLELSDGGFDAEFKATLNGCGDLISRVALEIVLPPLAAPVLRDDTGAVRPPADCSAHYVNGVGFACWESLRLVIAGFAVEHVFSDFAFVHEELACRPGFDMQIGRVPGGSDADGELIEKAKCQQTLVVPIPLCFSDSAPLAISALTVYNCHIGIKTRTLQECTCVVYKDAAGAFRLEEGARPVNAATGRPLVDADLRLRLAVTVLHLSDPERTFRRTVEQSLLVAVRIHRVDRIPAIPKTRLELNLLTSDPDPYSLIWFLRPLDWATAAGRRRRSAGFRDRYDFTSRVPGTVDLDAFPYGDCTDPIATASLSLTSRGKDPESIGSDCFRTMPGKGIYAYVLSRPPECRGIEDWYSGRTTRRPTRGIERWSLAQTFAPGVKASELLSTDFRYDRLVIEHGWGTLKYSAC